MNNREVAHRWANSVKESANGHNLRFEGPVLYSYATVIGRIIRHKGRPVYVLDSHSFSNSTSKHQSYARQAIGYDTGRIVFHVDCGQRGQWLNFTPAELRDYYLAKFAELKDALPSRYAHIRAEQYKRATEQVREARRVCEVFGLSHKRVDLILAGREIGESNADELLRAVRVKRIEQQAERERALSRERREANIKGARELIDGTFVPEDEIDLTHKQAALEALPDDLRESFVAAVAAHNAKVRERIQSENRDKIARWRAGETLFLPYDLPVMLRADGSDMQTSKDVRVPLDEARRAYLFCNKVRAKGWHRNGETCPVGGYQVDAVNEFGVIAGCHRIAWDEIDAFAKAQGWAK